MERVDIANNVEDNGGGDTPTVQPWTRPQPPPPDAATLEALTNFCKHSQESTSFAAAVREQRKGPSAARSAALDGLREELCEIKCVALPPRMGYKYARLKPYNQTATITTVMLREVMSGITEHDLSAVEWDDLIPSLEKIILSSLREARTQRKQIAELSDTLPREVRGRVVGEASPRILALALALKTARDALREINGQAKARKEALPDPATHQPPILQYLSDSQKTSQRLHLKNAQGEREVYYVRKKTARTKPGITLPNVKSSYRESVRAVWRHAPQCVEDLLEHMDALAEDLIVRIEDGRAEVIVERLALDHGRACGRKRSRECGGSDADVDADASDGCDE
jgi:hypothetical protein